MGFALDSHFRSQLVFESPFLADGEYWQKKIAKSAGKQLIDGTIMPSQPDDLGTAASFNNVPEFDKIEERTKAGRDV